ncbi:Arb2 domain-containing protein [Parachaetomium inaequale]|uniref:Arb2 domain-containing protein n=1 Tax=Parachaetomium inaequale TaxID=2588326 RepID=A0AAN6PJ64_9PEZI|nr:Arb2 domain-containing protein [Parachaetomium inaequale]
MFRRRWSGLPADPVFASDLKELGYFINDVDEIRSIEDPDYYFKYFLTKNDRWNERQRFAFNEAIHKEIHARLDAQNFTTIPLPLGTPPTKPHVPIRTSPNISTATRVVLLFGESSQALGVLAHRVIGGKGGGVTCGSVLGLIAALNTQRSSAADPSPPAIVLANAGELWWWPEGGHGLTPVARHGVPMASAVHLGRYHDAKVNEIPGNRTVREHVRGVFEAVVLGGGMVREEAKVDVIALGDTADEVEGYLDDDRVWEKVGRRLGCLVTLGSCYSSKEFKCEGFKRFMAERARAYMMHHTPLDTPVAGPGGNPGAAGFTSYGCPVYSAGEARVIETMLIEAQPAVLNWMQQVALEGEAYKNAVVEIYGEEEVGQGSSWWGVPDNGNDENEAETQTKDTEAADDEVKDGGEAQINQENGKASGSNAQANDNNAPANGNVVQAVGNDGAGVGMVEAQGGKAKPVDGPNAQDMKDLVKEIKDLKITN